MTKRKRLQEYGINLVSFKTPISMVATPKVGVPFQVIAVFGAVEKGDPGEPWEIDAFAAVMSSGFLAGLDGVAHLTVDQDSVSCMQAVDKWTVDVLASLADDELKK